MDGPPDRLRLVDRELSSFQVCGLTGFAAACAVALGLSAARGLSLRDEALLIALAVAVFLGLAVATKAITGTETLIYYHHEIAVLAAVAALAALLDAPVLAHLDATALGLGAFLACGRVGCLLAGCCHGRPAHRGVRYGPRPGFPAYLVGVRLIPVQVVEAAAVTGLVLAGATVVSSTAGNAFGFYVTGYAVIRFTLEEFRGDPGRRYWRGLSEAQWTSLLVATSMTVMAIAGWVPGGEAHAAVAALLAVTAVIVARRPAHDLLHPRGVRELAALLPTARPGAPELRTTSQGLCVSAGRADGHEHYAFTRAGRPLTGEEAAGLARLVVWLRGAPGLATVVRGPAAAVHVVLEDGVEPRS
jgi:Prolipoprotein diacylglyceryl transferase